MNFLCVSISYHAEWFERLKQKTDFVEKIKNENFTIYK